MDLDFLAEAIKRNMDINIGEEATARITGLARQTLRNDRAKDRKLPYIKVGRKVLYNLPTVLAYMRAHKIEAR